MSRRDHHHFDYYRFILIALLKEGPLSQQELVDRTTAMIDQFYTFGISFAFSILPRFGINPYDMDDRREMRRREQDFKASEECAKECESLLTRNMVIVNQNNKYELTEAGKKTAAESAEDIEKWAKKAEHFVLSPGAAAKNTVIIDFFLAAMKLLAGFLSGSVGLIADGADAAVDTASAFIVWLGIKFKKELLGTVIVILMMFITAGTIGYESISKIVYAFTSTLQPLARPYLVIIVEGIALLAALILSFYQRYVGKRHGSLALISQSIDSRNHIYVATAVIVGAIFSIFGIHFIDALIGMFIAVRILIDGVELAKEALSAAKGEETDFSKYILPFEKHWHLSKLESFRSWILYTIKDGGPQNKDELIQALERTFKPGYLPLVSEFRFGIGDGFDFLAEFDNLVDPLLDSQLLIRKDDQFMLTKEGRKRVKKIFSDLRYH
jgi:Co/Zn/Cd efflux system component